MWVMHFGHCACDIFPSYILFEYNCKFYPYLIWHGELKKVEPIGVPLHDDLLEVLQVLKYR